MAQLEAERTRLEQQRQWAAAEAAEKERKLQMEVARREEEAKKFKDDIEKVRGVTPTWCVCVYVVVVVC